MDKKQRQNLRNAIGETLDQDVAISHEVAKELEEQAKELMDSAASIREKSLLVQRMWENNDIEALKRLLDKDSDILTYLTLLE
jgi:hypothetical protein